MYRLSALIAVLLFSASICVQEDPIAVTTDTKDYCISLATRLDATGAMSPHAHDLWVRGRSMCEQGHVRRGLFRLRRAMQMVRGTAE
jgi:hypothetical protein